MSTTTSYYLAFDGYGYHSEGASPELSRHALISSDYVYVPESTAIEIPFFTEDDIEIVYVKDGSTVTVDTASDFDNTSANAVNYVSFTPNANHTPYIINVFNNGQTTKHKSINLIPVCEPKFTPVKCQFINKFGVIQCMYFFLRQTESMNVEDSLYMRNTIDTNATYNINEGQFRRHGVKAQNSIRLSTGYVNENFNQTIEELLLTENCWITFESVVTAAMPVTKTMQHKTSLNDKLIDYQIQFDFASHKINTVR